MTITKLDSYFKRVQHLTPTRYWVNNPTRMQAKESISYGAVGCTTNPALLSKVLVDAEERKFIHEVIREELSEETNDTKVLENVQRRVVSEIATIFKPLHDLSGGNKGFVSIQGDPFKETVDNIIGYARANTAVSSNILAKIPVTPNGLLAIRELLSTGVPVLATEVMSVAQFIDVAELYEELKRKGQAKATLIFAQIAGIFDQHLSEYVKNQKIDIWPDTLWYAGLEIMRKIEQIKHERGYTICSLSGGARALHHFTDMVGADSGVTINWVGTSEELIAQNPSVVRQFCRPTPFSVIDELCCKLRVFKQAYEVNGLAPEEYEAFGPVALFRSMFEDGWKSALDVVAECRKQGR